MPHESTLATDIRKPSLFSICNNLSFLKNSSAQQCLDKSAFSRIRPYKLVYTELVSHRFELVTHIPELVTCPLVLHKFETSWFLQDHIFFLKKCLLFVMFNITFFRKLIQLNRWTNWIYYLFHDEGPYHISLLYWISVKLFLCTTQFEYFSGIYFDVLFSLLFSFGAYFPFLSSYFCV